MLHKYLYLILFIPFYLQGTECSDGLVEFENICYNKDHIDVLQDFVDLNPSLAGLQPQNIGYQKWINNQLTYLYLGNNNIEALPDSIGLLKGLWPMQETLIGQIVVLMIAAILSVSVSILVSQHVRRQVFLLARSLLTKLNIKPLYR